MAKLINLDSLEKRLTEVKLPPEIQIDSASVIKDVKKFFETHIAVMRTNPPHSRMYKSHEYRVRIAAKAIKEFNKTEK